MISFVEELAGDGRYQSIDCGGSSLEWEVLTVSTQPRRSSRSQPFILGKRSVSPDGRQATKGQNRPGIGSFPCRFKKAEYALINFCA